MEICSIQDGDQSNSKRNSIPKVSDHNLAFQLDPPKLISIFVSEIQIVDYTIKDFLCHSS